ncbi:hypothetical protein [Cognatishimia sp. MH4019]|uniref:hypothetical protein n=1 Tax=Cognatishimia sp. MH4019 TaxID=2854030 RepID=UPI001CD1D108|nr:hypothetical protein [Cognatishimia sp. MH4019]
MKNIFVLFVSFWLATGVAAENPYRAYSEAIREFVESYVSEKGHEITEMSGAESQAFQRELREYMDTEMNRRFNLDWQDETELLDAYLTLVEQCDLPASICEAWAARDYTRYSGFGESFVVMSLLSDAVPSVGSPAPVRCEASHAGFVNGPVLRTETYSFVVRTHTSDANSPCFLQKLGQ